MNDASSAALRVDAALGAPASRAPGRAARLRPWLSVAAYLVIGWLAWRHLDGRAILTLGARLRPWHVGVGLAVSLLHILLRALRYHALVRRLGPEPPYSWLDGVRVFAVGLSASAVTPGRVGDFVKITLLEPYGISRSRSFAIVLTERLLDLFVILAFAIVFGWSLPAFRGAAAWHRAGVVFMVPLALSLAAVFAPRGRRALVAVSDSIFGKRSPRIAALVRSITESFLSLFPGRGSVVPFVTGSLVVWAVEFSKLWVVLALLGHVVALPVVMFVYPASILVGIVSFIPASEGVIGVTGAALLCLLSSVDATTAASALLLDRALSTLPPLALWGALAGARAATAPKGADGAAA